LDGELAERPTELTRLPGGGQPPIEKKDPALIEQLKALVEGETAGDPMSERKWRRSSLRALSQALGAKISHTTVGRVLKDLDYSLKANVKRLTGAPHPDRETQFAYIASRNKRFARPDYQSSASIPRKKSGLAPSRIPVGAGVKWPMRSMRMILSRMRWQSSAVWRV
jgi:Rhodopirellula transposase DDE domain